ncbi:MAG: hypothetical protein IT374_07180 [Polyangiaceae bacterium]|nr:hypothetical protein [Polyangiaceae bacterium]
MDQRRRDVLGIALAVGLTTAGGAARAEGGAFLWPTATPAGDGPSGGELRAVSPKDGPLRDRAREIDAILAEAAQDLGLTIDLDARPDIPPGVRDADLVELADKRAVWILSPRVERDGNELVVRIVAARPGSKTLLVRSERVRQDALSLRLVVMLRDLVSTPAATRAEEPRSSRPARALTDPARSDGRGALALSAAAYGGFLGFAIKKTSRSEDDRLLYPLMAVGTGLGLGASLIAADEWDVTQGEALYLNAAMTWPTASALLLSDGYRARPRMNRYAFGLAAGVGGVGLATLAVSQRQVSQGGALVAHSGGALGTFGGAMGEYLARGELSQTPNRGLGYGAGAGVLVGGVLGTQIDPSPTRVVLFDVGAGLGALGGAALGSPLLRRDATPTDRRGFIGATLAGAVGGATLALVATRHRAPSRLSRWPLPVPTVLGFSPSPGGPVPIVGATTQGTF